MSEIVKIGRKPLTAGGKLFREWVDAKNGLGIDTIRGMIFRVLGGNADSKDAGNAPLTQFVEPSELFDRLNSLKPLADLMAQNPGAAQAVQSAASTNLTVDQLAGLLASTGT